MKTTMKVITLTVVAIFLNSNLVLSQTWQRTYPNVAAVNAVTPAFNEGYIVGATLLNGNGLLMKIDEDGNEVWRREIPSSKGMIIQALIADTVQKCYFFAGSEGFTFYLSRWPYWSYMKKPSVALIGKIKDDSNIDWLNKDIIDKGYETTSYGRLQIIGNYVVTSGFSASIKKNNFGGFIHAYDKTTGKLTKTFSSRWYPDFVIWNNQLIALYKTREKDNYFFTLEQFDENLKSVKKTQGTPLGALYFNDVRDSYLLLPNSNDLFSLAFIHALDKVSTNPTIALQTIMPNSKKPNYPSKVAGIGESSIYDKCVLYDDAYLLFTGRHGCTSRDFNCDMVYLKADYFLVSAKAKIFRYSDYNPSEKNDYPSTIGYDICPSKDGGAVIVGFATKIYEENNEKFSQSNRKGWIIKIDSNGNL